MARTPTRRFSLLRLASLAVVGIGLCVVAAGAYLAWNNYSAQLALEAADEAGRAQADEVELRLNRIQNVLADAVVFSRARAHLSGNVGVEEIANAIRSRGVTNILDLGVVPEPVEAAELDGNGGNGFAMMEMLLDALEEGRAPVQVHFAGTGNEHLAFSQRLDDGQRPRAVIYLTLPTSMLYQQIQPGDAVDGIAIFQRTERGSVRIHGRGSVPESVATTRSLEGTLFEIGWHKAVTIEPVANRDIGLAIIAGFLAMILGTLLYRRAGRRRAYMPQPAAAASQPAEPVPEPEPQRPAPKAPPKAPPEPSTESRPEPAPKPTPSPKQSPKPPPKSPAESEPPPREQPAAAAEDAPDTPSRGESTMHSLEPDWDLSEPEPAEAAGDDQDIPDEPPEPEPENGDAELQYLLSELDPERKAGRKGQAEPEAEPAPPAESSGSSPDVADDAEPGTAMDEAPADQAPADEAPVHEAPVDDALADEAPADQVPAPEEPADTAPAGEAEAPVPAEQLPARAIFRAYDIRGVMGETLDEIVAGQIGRAIGSEAADRGLTRIAVARDGRLSGARLLAALGRGLVSAGMEVIEVGAVPTPVLYFAARELTGGSGVMVTGSHNPPDYNGFKIMLGGDTLSGEAITGLYDRLAEGRLRRGDGHLSEQSVTEQYLERIGTDIQLERPLKVVADCGNGIAGMIAPKLLAAIGAEVIPLYAEVDGSFPNHHPDPGDPETLEDLKLCVRNFHADLGVAFDGDGDRLGVVAPDGEIIWPDRLMMLFARDVLSRNPGAPVIFDVKCSGQLAREIEAAGGRPVMARTGHSFIKRRLIEEGAPLAGEMSGHFFFGERWYGFDDGLYAACRLLEILAADTRASGQILAGLPKARSTPELKVPMNEGEPHAFVEAFQEQADFGEAEITTIDGLRADFPDGWGLVRASNTTPVLVLRFEGDDAAALEKVQAAFREKMLAVNPALELPF